MKNLPPELIPFQDDLGSYGPQSFDSYCGEPIAWGWKIINHLGSRWPDLQKVASTGCHGVGNWYVYDKSLTHEEAIEKYGPVTNENIGPKGGFKSRTYGDKQFAVDLTNYRL